ncbi:MAG: single-stranded-DNA-specific exonuclease RecJ [Verrucomicrobiota bacterium]|jgi:single-stranded-DNA-specific exonuclease
MSISHAPSARWILQEPDPAALKAIQDSPLGDILPPLICRLLALRGLPDEKTAHAFLHPKLAELSDPFLLPQMQEAVARIFKAIHQKESVILYGDYDVDGVTSLTLLMLTLRAYGLEANCYLPLRMEEGYGLSREGLARSFEKHGKPHLLIALDCGTCSIDEAAWLKAEGVDCLIVDHHDPLEQKPLCVALINPKLNGAFTYFCTVGLVFKLAHALLKTRRLEGFDLREHLDLVAMGTVADLVPLRDENRVIVQKGLEKLTDTKRPGLCALKVVAGMDGAVQAHHIGFRLGPRLNAAGRLDTAQTSLDLLLCEDFIAARDGAALLDTHNKERQDVEAVVQKEATFMLEADPSIAAASCIVLGSRTWHPGVVGIVASRIMREYHRPTLLLAINEEGLGKGSGRSVSGVSLVQALDSCRHLLVRGGGHPMAVGISLTEDNIPAFRAAMSASVETQVTAEELAPKLHIDAELSLADLTPDFLQHYNELEPFGMGNPEPVFLCRQVTPRLPGQILKDKHWKLLLHQDGEMRPAIWFNAPWRNPPAPPWDVALKIQRHLWRGQESWQLMISDVRSAEG